MAIGRFCALGFQVTRDQVRRTIRETDPLNTILRWPGELTSRRLAQTPCGISVSGSAL